MDFPARPPMPAIQPELQREALAKEPASVLVSPDLLVIFDSQKDIEEFTPDFEKKKLNDHAVIVSAPGVNCDFISRFFAPNVGINEDPVTGSAHCTLIPYWAERLGKNRLHAFQLSSRKGELFCEYENERVLIAGHAVLFAKGEIYL